MEIQEIYIYSELFHNYNCCVIIPTYNNSQTIENVINKVLLYTSEIIVVNDGSTDKTESILASFPQINIVSYSKNQGKGYALRMGFEYANQKNYDYAITIDSDGQHFPNDIPVFLNKLKENPESIMIGARNMEQESVPGKSSFGNKFSNFWFKFETNIELPDTQSGYRLYPLKLLKNIRFFTKKYEFEIEVIVRAAWKGIDIISVPVKVYYPSQEERITHFRPFRDFTRVSILNTILVIIALLYIKPRNYIRLLFKKKPKEIFNEYILQSNDSNIRIASAVGFGIFMGIVPIWGFQMLVAVFIAHLLKLNKAIVLIASNISIPPMIPFILFFSYKTGIIILGKMGGNISVEFFRINAERFVNGNYKEVMTEISYTLVQYIIGSIVFGVALGLCIGVIFFILLSVFRKK